jgi:hypothetical protein
MAVLALGFVLGDIGASQLCVSVGGEHRECGGCSGCGVADYLDTFL